MELTNSTNVLEALVSNNRSELGKTFGVGMFVSETDTPEQVKAKCKSFVARFETYIANLNVIINSGDELASEMRKARVKRLYSALDENEKEDIKGLSLKPWGIALKFLFLHHENILFPND